MTALSPISIALVRDVFLITIAMIVIGLSAFTGVAGIAYQMSQVERKYAGVANSLFTLGTALGLVPLFIITVLLNLGNSFVDIIQWLLLAGGGLYLIAALIRATVLESIPNPSRVRQDTDVLRDFIGENIRGLKLLFKVLPIFVAVICIDAFSDAFYRFASLYYVNETLNFGMNEINLMFLITLIFSVPLTLYIGRVFDKRGGRKLTIVVYAIMPIAVGLLIFAQYVPYVAPQGWLDALDAVFPGLSIILSLAFIATAIKQTNDILWYSILGTYIQKSMPRQDLGKMMSLNNVVVMVFISFGPIPAGFIYDMWQGLPLLYIVLILNVLILIVLAARSIEPTIDVDELERNDELRLE